MSVLCPKLTLSLLISSALLPLTSQAADFTIGDGETVMPQTLSANETGIVEVGGVIDGATRAIDATGDHIVIKNSGTIKVGDDYGIHADGDDVTITNSGTLTVTDEYGIYSTGDDATITNSGTITADNLGIYSALTSTNAVITNSGTVTVGDNKGIRSVGTNAVITNSGTVTVGGNSGISSFGANAVITNSGAITVGGNYGISSFGANAVITNSGTVDATNNYGIYSAGTNAVITNSGAITAVNEGIFLIGPNSVITNSGTITAATDAIYSSGADAVINNSGSIRATDAGGIAVGGLTNDVTLNLLAGSQIIGGIDLGGNGGDNDTVNVYGGSLSANLTFTNVENINLIGVNGVLNGNTVVTVEPTAQATNSVSLSDFTSSVHNVVNQRINIKPTFKPVQVAALTLSPEMLFQEHTPVAWAQVFGGNASYDAQGETMAYGSNHVGFSAGYEWDIKQTRFGLLGGVAHASADSDVTSFKSESTSYYLGGYGLFYLGSVNLSTSLMAGYADNDNDRMVIDNLNGVEVAHADFDSVFLSPSVTLSSAYILADNLEFRPSASINYSMAWVDSYQEKGTTSSNLKVDDRTLRVLTARAQLAAAYKFNSYSELEFRVGLSSRHSNDDDTDASIGGNSFSYSNAGDENVDGRFAGVNLRIADQNNLTLAVDMEFGGNSDEDYVNGHISLACNF